MAEARSERPAEDSLPYPPVDLMQRVGSLGEVDVAARYTEVGQDIKRIILDTLPRDWSFHGKRVLDFGCGAGRVMRQFTPELEVCEEFWGCEIDEPSVRWMQRHMCPPFHVVRNEERPPINAPRAHFDLVYAMSVFTHITDRWADWLLEMHRLLRPGGLLLATFLGEAMMGKMLNRAWDEDRVGIAFAGCGAGWDEGGPLTFMSPWWIRAHWGRAFEMVSLDPGPRWTTDGDQALHGVVLARRREVELTVEQLEAPEPTEPREYAGAAFSIDVLRRELAQTRQTAKYWAQTSERHSTRAADLEHALDTVYTSRSWRITEPMRMIARRVRGR